jgi:two-component system chemotaxis response regulator CheB
LKDVLFRSAANSAGKSCVVFGMPKEAIARGGVDEVVLLADISRRIASCLAVQGRRVIRV